MVMKIPIVFFMALLIILTGFAYAHGQTTFALYCRGPFDYISLPSGLMQIHLNPSATAAGNLGVNLKSGVCAWSDRPLASDEPKTLLYPDDDHGFFALSLCSNDSSCTFMVRAYNDFTGRMRVSDRIVWIWHR